ncbi:MobA-like NTP transferase domain-containing protein [Sphingomonas laterariae]|uniref:MobA-like NTP transferase domain-containing protein n=1 Tax=Edaphosphingomonas laterariae TaxID=861865 RepID=A0A239CTN4_9SPHN|nr:nucleotidyltransferase family protein [Sphingomonas laterariae]SNS23606.1 MobA-like NTP transferase domain-containing protein [Sphingomonas laterariae]
MNEQGKWTAILLAGSRPGGDPFAEQHGERFKARVPIAGEAMIAHVVRTLAAVDRIGRIVILSQEPEAVIAGDLGWIGEHPKVALKTSGQGISRSIADIAGTAAAPWPVLIATADHPLLAPSDVELFLNGVGDADVAVAMVPQHVLLAAYPDNKRTWLRFSDGGFTGANLFGLTGPNVSAVLDLWANAEKDRKAARKLMLRFGPCLAIRALTRTITLASALATAGKRLGVKVRPVLLDRAEAGIDVDKASDYALASSILERQNG